MPRIEEYGIPQVEAQVPLEVSARPIEEAGQGGRAVQRFADQFEQIGNEYEKRASQEEVADAQIDFAGARAEYTGKLNKQIQSGNVDTEQLMSDYDQKINDLGDKYQTAHGRRAFDRQAALTRGMVLRGAINARAHLAGEQAKAKLQGSLDRDSSALFNDPSSFPDVFQANMDAIDDQVNAGSLPSAVADKLKHQYGTELAKSAVRGWAQIDPDKAEGLLNGRNNGGKGAFDEYFDGDVKAQMQGYINTQKNAREVDANRSEALNKKAQEKRAEAWKIQNLSRLENHELSAQEVIQAAQGGDLRYEDAKEQIGMIEKHAKGDSATDYQLMNNLTSRIYADDNDPNKIRDSSEIDKMAAQGRLRIEDRNRLVKAIDDTPEGRNLRVNRKQLMDFMNAQLVKKDSMLGLADPLGERNLAAAMQALQTKEDEFRKEKKPLSALYDPSNKDSFYNTVSAFKLSPRDIMNQNMQMMRSQKGAESAVQNADKAKAVLPRQSGETIDQWLKRRRQSGGQ